MTTTNYIGLTQLEGHEYYSHIIENENLTKIDNALKENNDRTTVIEDKINKKEKLTVNLSSASRVVSVNDSCAGACEIEFKGWTNENILDLSRTVVAGSHKHNIVSVEVGKTYIFKNRTTCSISLYYGEKDDLSSGITSIGNGLDFELTPTSNRVSLYLIDGASDEFGESMIISNTHDTEEYHEGLFNHTDPSVTMTGKNVIDFSKAIPYNGTLELVQSEYGYIHQGTFYTHFDNVKLEVGKAYTMSWNAETLIGSTAHTWRYLYRDGTLSPSIASGTAMLMAKEVDQILVYTEGSGNIAKAKITNISLVEGTTAPSTFIPYQSNTKTYEGQFAGLPNGVADSIEDVKGKTIKTIKTNFGRDGEYYQLKTDDITALYTAHANVDAIKFGKLVDDVNYNDSTSMGTLNNLNVSGFRNNTYIDDVGHVGSVVVANSTEYGLFVAKGTYATLAEAKTSLAGTKILYQLAEPITEELPHESAPVIAYNDYTQLSSTVDMTVKYPADLASSVSTMNSAVANMGEALDEHGKLLKNGKSMTVDLDCKDSVKSFKDAYNGSADFEVEGSLVEQLVKNGDFADGTTGWTAKNSTGFTVDNGIIKCTPMVTSGGITQNLNMINGHKYAISARVKTPVANKVKVWVSGVGTETHSGSGEFEVLTAEFEWIHDTKGWAIQVVDASTSDFTEMQVDYVMLIDLTNNSLRYNDIDLKSYQEGLQPLRGAYVETIGKNLQKEQYYNGKASTGQLLGMEINSNLEDGTNYIVSGKYNKLTTYSQSMYFYGLDSSNNVITSVYNPTTSPQTGDFEFSFVHDEKVVKYILPIGSSSVFNIEYDNVQLEEGTNPTQYTPYKSSLLSIDRPLTQWDKVIREGGKTVLHAGSNVGRDGIFYELKGDDFISFNVKPNANYAYTGEWFLSGLTEQTAEINSDVVIEGREESITNGTFWSDAGLTNVFATGAGNGILYLSFPPEVNTLAKAQVVIDESNTKVAYQLATPYTVDLTDKIEILSSYDGYTQMSVGDGLVEGEKAKLSISTSGNSYFINADVSSTFVSDSKLQFKVKKILGVYELSNGEKRDLTSLFDVTTSASQPTWNINGIEGYTIGKADTESNNIDINNIYVDYTTLETNGQANATIKYSSDLASAFSSAMNTISVMGDALDKATGEVARLTKPLEWIEPTLLNGWSVYSGTTIAYAKDSLGWVHIKGDATGGTVNTEIFYLPTEFRPSKINRFSSVSSGAFGYAYVSSTGGVVLAIGDSGYFAMEMSFYAGN